MIDIRQIVNYDYSYQNLPDTTLEERFSMLFRPIERPLLSWKEEVNRTAQNIKLLAGSRPIILCLSGGLDSEAVAHTFINNGINFSAISLRHIEGTNGHDINPAISFCQRHGIKHTLIEMDPYDFFIHGVNKYIDQGYRARKIFRYQQLLLVQTVESMGGCAVLGGGDQLYYNWDNRVCLRYAPDFNMVLDWCNDNNTVHFPYFYMQNPHIFAAYLKEELIEFLITKPKYFRDNWGVNQEKELIYTATWPELFQRMKFTGFEYINPLKNAIERGLEKFDDISEMSIPVSFIKKQIGI